MQNNKLFSNIGNTLRNDSVKSLLASLFSILIGALATVYFISRAAWIKIKFLFTGKKGNIDKSSYRFVIYNEDIRYWNVFKPVLDAFENHETEVTYFTSCKEDPVFNAEYKFVFSHGIYPPFSYINLLISCLFSYLFSISSNILFLMNFP